MDETPEDKAQRSFTDPELGIMQTNNKGWDDCGNAQVSVDETYQIIVACDVTAEANDKQQAVPMAQLTVAQLEQAGIKTPQAATGAAQPQLAFRLVASVPEPESLVLAIAGAGIVGAFAIRRRLRRRRFKLPGPA